FLVAVVVHRPPVDSGGVEQQREPKNQDQRGGNGQLGTSGPEHVISHGNEADLKHNHRAASPGTSPVEEVAAYGDGPEDEEEPQGGAVAADFRGGVVEALGFADDEEDAEGDADEALNQAVEAGVLDHGRRLGVVLRGAHADESSLSELASHFWPLHPHGRPYRVPV